MANAGAGRRVVVTGLGVITPIGSTLEEFWSNLLGGKCGIGPIEGVPGDHRHIKIAAQVKDFDPKQHLRHWARDKTILHSDRYSWLAAAAASQAVAHAKLNMPFADPYRAACIIGSAAGGQIAGEKACRDRFIDQKRAVHPMFLPRMIASSAAAHIGIEFGVKGPTFAICSADASASHSIGVGCDYIRRGLVDLAIVGGTDSPITYGALLAGRALNLLSPDGCFPFCAHRNGTVLAESAGVLILESEAHANARGVNSLAEICGIGMSSNGCDMITPLPTAMRDAMGLALKDAGLAPTDIDYVNAHGTATVLNDRAETIAIKQLFGDHARKMGISSTKSMHGHAMGASAALEAAACIKAMGEGRMPPTIGLDAADPDCDLDYVANVARERELTYVMSNAFALGGLNAVMVFGSPPG